MSAMNWVSSFWAKQPPKLTPEEAESLSRRIDRYLPSSGHGEGASGSDRRRAPRYKPRRSHVCLGWWDDGDFRLLGAQIVDISVGGALVESEETPPRGQSVWLRREAALPSEGRKAVVLDARWHLLKMRYTIRFRFEDEVVLDTSEVIPA